MAESHDSMVKRFGRALAVLCVIGGLVLLGVSQVRQQELTQDLEHETEVRIAQTCVSEHERVAQIRDSVEFVIRTNADTLLSLATPESGDEQIIARYRELVEGDVVEARRTIGVPDCDLVKARAILATD